MDYYQLNTFFHTILNIDSANTIADYYELPHS